MPDMLNPATGGEVFPQGNEMGPACGIIIMLWTRWAGRGLTMGQVYVVRADKSM